MIPFGEPVEPLDAMTRASPSCKGRPLGNEELVALASMTSEGAIASRSNFLPVGGRR